jgi:hypothetical protein
MSLIAPMEEDGFNVSKFIDFDKEGNTFYDNVYLDDYKIVVKMPLLKKRKDSKEIQIKKFTLENYTFLFSYE